MNRLENVWILLAALAVTGWVGPRAARAGEEDSPIPSQLSRAQQKNLQKFLAGLGKAKRLIPENSRAVGFAALSPDLTRAARITEYLTAIIPERPTAAQAEPRQAEVFWYRRNPTRGKPGVTVKRVVNLDTGKQVGPTEVFCDYPTPLAPAEVREAIQFAREQSAQVKQFYKKAENSNVHVDDLLAQVGASGPGGAERGDRVVNLQFHDEDAPGFVSVEVNLTRGTVAETDRE